VTELYGIRIPIERIEADGTITKGTCRARGGTLDDFRSINGIPMELPAGASFCIPVEIHEPES